MKKIFDIVIKVANSEDVIFSEAFTTKKLAEKTVENIKSMPDIPEDAEFEIKERNLLTAADAQNMFKA